jgi:inosine/xanthosine triphosphate pyrophosphatase family protein
MYFVTGNDKKWTEIQAILGDSVDIKRSNIDCKIKILKKPDYTHAFDFTFSTRVARCFT